MTKKNQPIENKNTCTQTKLHTQIWKNLWEHPLSIIFYFFIFCYLLHPKCIHIIFRGTAKYFTANNFIVLAPVIISMIVFIFILNTYGKKIFINIFNSFFLISLVLSFILAYKYNNIIMLVPIIVHNFYYVVFIILIIIFLPSKTKKTLSNQVKLFWIILCVLVPYIYYFSLAFYHHLRNVTF